MQSKIIHEENSFLVLYKPAGIAIQSAQAFKTDVLREVTNYLAKKQGSVPYVGMVHRLDQPVEGLLVFGKNQKTTANLSKQLSENQKSCRKDYVAVVSVENGQTFSAGQTETLIDYLEKDAKLSLAKITDEKKGKRAELTYEVVEQVGEIALLNIQLKTGRFHQIRAQLSNAGLPIIGDQKYGSEKAKSLANQYRVKTVALCANQLMFLHPITGAQVGYCKRPENPIFEQFQLYKS